MSSANEILLNKGWKLYELTKGKSIFYSYKNNSILSFYKLEGSNKTKEITLIFENKKKYKEYINLLETLELKKNIGFTENNETHIKYFHKKWEFTFITLRNKETLTKYYQ